ncbi:ABC transporter permease (plasmid) [Rhizobium sp. CB3171]|uniref:ABC transporter permease n=1 Tax=Rhizobium sp. CB3171 TaxID=3039157 RepID=UPI0024B24668|nr:ABC transporter permease [Rhizobium sp. CB3171]WFU06791.1 ABC transporter permease [Rhizobium sp. CB3171]
MTGLSLIVFVTRRIAVVVPLLLVISFGCFALVHIAPGDPVRSLIGAHASDPVALAAIRAHYHLDDPFLVQYWKWLSQVVRGDLGVSIQGNQAVTSVIADRLGVTVFLSLMSIVLVLGFGILLGAVAAFHHDTWLDRLVVAFGIFGVSAPTFVTGIFLLYVFGVMLHWFPIFGPGSGFLDRAWHLTLPAFALAISVMAIVVKITRAAMIEELSRDYVMFARARGLSSRRILFAYVLRNSLIPVVTAAGLIVVGIVAGAIYVEVTFSLPGLGALAIDAILKRDIPTIQGTTLLFSAFVVLTNLVVDVIYALIDPRIHFGRVGS